MHINMSIQNHDELMQPFLAGILHHMDELTLFLNPSEDSYKRFGKDKAPKYVTWSYQNRSQLIRIPATHSTNRMELRSPDCSCNTYLAYALLIYAGLEGIEKNYELQPCTDMNLYNASREEVKDLKVLPLSLESAKEKVKNSAWLKEVIDLAILDCYAG